MPNITFTDTTVNFSDTMFKKLNPFKPSIDCTLHDFMFVLEFDKNKKLDLSKYDLKTMWEINKKINYIELDKYLRFPCTTLRGLSIGSYEKGSLWYSDTSVTNHTDFTQFIIQDAKDNYDFQDENYIHINDFIQNFNILENEEFLSTFNKHLMEYNSDNDSDNDNDNENKNYDGLNDVLALLEQLTSKLSSKDFNTLNIRRAFAKIPNIYEKYYIYTNKYKELTQFFLEELTFIQFINKVDFNYLEFFKNHNLGFSHIINKCKNHINFGGVNYIVFDHSDEGAQEYLIEYIPTISYE